ncbi:MAG TPA: SRPBCC family protein [Gaiellaceae bacterium]|nr:SRPBCC family protein [Gaiellaceae bacterium]
MPQFAARRVLPATLDDVWSVLDDAERFAEWWPGIDRIESTVRRAVAPGALWQVEGPNRQSLFRRGPQLSGTLLVLDVVPPRRLVFQLSEARIDARLELEADEDDQAAATLSVEAPRFSGVGRAFPSQALASLAALVRPPAVD